MTETPSNTISVRPLLDKSSHLLGEIAALPKNSSPDKYEKRARAIGEMYKTATIIETFAANFQSHDMDQSHYDTQRPASPEQEQALRDDLLGYYDRIHGRSGGDGGDVGETERREPPADVLQDVATDSAGGPASAG